MVVLWIPTAKWGKSVREPSVLRVVGDGGGGWNLECFFEMIIEI